MEGWLSTEKEGKNFVRPSKQKTLSNRVVYKHFNVLEGLPINNALRMSFM